MELFRTEQYYIFVAEEHSLWWDRRTAEFVPKTRWDITDADDPECLGVCHGIVGKVEHAVFEPRLIIIKECSPVGHLHGDHVVYKIKSIAFLQTGPDNQELNLLQCHKHKSQPNVKEGKKLLNSGLFDLQKNVALSKTWGTLKSAGNTLRNTTQQAASQVKATVKRREFKDREKFEKRILEEFYKIFNDTDSFYFSRSTDITNSLQRLCKLEKSNINQVLWKTADDRFFWNKHMLRDLIDLDNSLCDPWILPIIQGFIQIEHCKVEVGLDSYGNEIPQPRYETFTLSLVSRRSRFRAGTRYKRRGVDEDGHCANYVETEQIVSYHHHEVSFVQVRGSVPVFWSQPGYKYRPPPRLDKGETETHAAFEKHFNNEIQIYGPVCIINLVDQAGKEKIIWDAYSNHVFMHNSPMITYATFDFHEYCRGMHFENVSILINSLDDVIRDMNYCWRDRQGQICSQLGVFRVNCIDCLDRTNVVQTALGKAIMEIQFTKLGLIPPDGIMPDTIRNTFQLLWANNGDIISKQYAGTNALKGDYTRTGERKFTGIMKDGMNSANRYFNVHFTDLYRQCCLDIMHGNDIERSEIEDCWNYLRTVGNIANELVPVDSKAYVPLIALGIEYEFANFMYHTARYYLSRFKDAYRQGTIDIMLGNFVSEDVFHDQRAVFEEDSAAALAEHVKLLIEDCKKMLLANPEDVLGAWGLIDADPYTGDPSETEMDTILILTRDSYFVADYDEQVDKVTKFQTVPLKDLCMLECGYAEAGVSLFKNSKQRYCIRLNYKVNGCDGYYHMFRSTNLRFFNNLAVVIKNEEEEIESLKSICEAFVVALDIRELPEIPFRQGPRLERRKSKVVSSGASKSIYLDITSFPQMTRNVSESQLLALKSAGSKALSNVTEQFSKLNRLGSNISVRTKEKGPIFQIGKSKTPKTDSSSESDDDYDVSIFQPSESSLPHNIHESKSTEIELGMDALAAESLGCECDSSNPAFLPSVGIVMSSANEQADLLQKKEKSVGGESVARVDAVSLSGVIRNVSLNNPEIQVSEDALDDAKSQPPNTLKLDKKHSHSSGEVDDKDHGSDSGSALAENWFDKRSNSEQDITLNISQSQSESALKHIRSGITNLTSPVATATKDLVFSPFSKLAKGMQNLGVNLDLKRMKGVRHVTEKEYEEHRKLQEKWRHCKTRLIAL